MNVLIDEFPTAVEIDGETYELNTNFRDCLEIMIMYENEIMLDEEKAIVMVNSLYKEKPTNLMKAIEMGTRFLDCGREIIIKVNQDEKEHVDEKANDKNYSFQKDAQYIYQAIKQSHQGMDLENVEYLHWWKFVYMFSDLDKDCFFSQMLRLRGLAKKGELSKEERTLYYSKDMRPIFDLNYVPEEEQEKSEFERLLGENE